MNKINSLKYSTFAMTKVAMNSTCDWCLHKPLYPTAIHYARDFCHINIPLGLLLLYICGLVTADEEET